MVRVRNQHAASLVMVAGLLLVITIVAVVAVQLITLFGGGQQVQRATDSGNLTAARSALIGVTVPLPNASPDSTNQLQFDGVADPASSNPSGLINLRNINRVMGQALLVNYNAYQINTQGQDNGAVTHAQQTVTAANNICTSLLTTLKSSPQLQSYFSSTSNAQPTTQFGKTYLSPSTAPTFSYLNRQTASNVFIAPQQIADYSFPSNSSNLYNTTLASNLTQVSSDPTDKYIKGYLDGLKPTQNNTAFQDIHFMPLKPGDKPHLVSAAEFNQNTPSTNGSPTFNWPQAVPDALSISATDKATDGGYQGGFNAFAIVEPIAPVGFAAAIPHGFIRISNGASSTVNGSATTGANDVFMYVMDNNQYYPTSSSGPMPYFTSDPSVLSAIIAANTANPPSTPDCSGLSVGSTLYGDTLGSQGVTASNCAKITGVGSGSAINNVLLDLPSSNANQDMHAFNNNDPRGLWARPVIEAAYNIPPPQSAGSGNTSVNVADIFNFNLLSARSQGNDFTVGTYQSGMASVPTTSRGPLPSPQFIIANQAGVKLGSDQPQGVPANGTMYNFIQQRMYEIDPTWPSYTTVNGVLDQNFIPMNGVAYIYYSKNGNNGKGGLVLNVQDTALADAPWLKNFYNQAADAKNPVNPTEVVQTKLLNDVQVDVSGDWGFEHPYDGEITACILNWYSFIPSSGFNNLLGEIDLGAVTTNCCSAGNNNTVSSFSINYGTNDTLSLPSGCQCSGSDCTYTGPC